MADVLGQLLGATMGGKRKREAPRRTVQWTAHSDYRAIPLEGIADARDIILEGWTRDGDMILYIDRAVIVNGEEQSRTDYDPGDTI